MASWRPDRVVVAALLAALALRLVFAFGYWVGKPLTHDEVEYLTLARNVVAGRGLHYDDPPGAPPAERFGRAPGYPLFLAAVLVAVPDAWTLHAVKAAQAVAGTVAVFLLALTAGRCAGRGAARATAWLAAGYPPLVWISAYVLSETLFMVLAFGAVLLLGRVVDPVRRGVEPARPVRWSLAAGVAAGAAALTRPAMLFFLPLACAWLLWKRRTAWLAVFALGAAIAILPWTLRNVREYGRVVLIASEGGITFWTGNHPLSPGEGDMAANPAIKRDNQRFRAEHRGLTPEELEPLYYREALQHIRDDPGWWIGLLARKAFYTVVPAGPSYTLHSRRYFLASVVSYGLLLPFGVAGWVALWRAGRTPVALGLLAAASVLAALVFLPQERFRIPVIDPALIVGAAAWGALRRSPDAAPAPASPA